MIMINDLCAMRKFGALLTVDLSNHMNIKRKVDECVSFSNNLASYQNSRVLQRHCKRVTLLFRRLCDFVVPNAEM